MTVIAELGINHNGELELAKKLIDAAADAGCDLVKLQKRTMAPDAYEFGLEEYKAIDAYCKEKGIGWFASAWDVPCQRFLQQFELEYNKVASSQITNVDLLNEIAAEGKHTFIGTGRVGWAEIDTALAILSGVPYTLMHTVNEYPMPEEDANLRMMEVMRERFSCPVGYIGHEQGIFVSTMAFVLGADALERQLTLDRTMAGPEHLASIEPDELKQLVTDIHRAQRIMGDGARSATK